MRTARFSDSGEEGGLPDPSRMQTPPRQTPCRQTPPLNKMTDASENITLPQTSFTGGNKVFCQLKKVTRLAKCYELLSDFVHKL